MKLVFLLFGEVFLLLTGTVHAEPCSWNGYAWHCEQRQLYHSWGYHHYPYEHERYREHERHEWCEHHPWRC